MILAYNRGGGIMLCEVETEREAFAEMRRFLKVNNIKSDVTNVRFVNEHYNSDNKRVPYHKSIAMICDRDDYGCCCPKTNGAFFSIFYDEKPEHLILGSKKDWGITKEVSEVTCEDENYRLNGSRDRFVCWYDEIQTYFEDKKRREAGIE